MSIYKFEEGEGLGLKNELNLRGRGCTHLIDRSERMVGDTSLINPIFVDFFKKTE